MLRHHCSPDVLRPPSCAQGGFQSQPAALAAALRQRCARWSAGLPGLFFALHLALALYASLCSAPHAFPRSKSESALKSPWRLRAMQAAARTPGAVCAHSSIGAAALPALPHSPGAPRWLCSAGLRSTKHKAASSAAGAQWRSSQPAPLPASQRSSSHAAGPGGTGPPGQRAGVRGGRERGGLLLLACREPAAAAAAAAGSPAPPQQRRATAAPAAAATAWPHCERRTVPGEPNQGRRWRWAGAAAERAAGCGGQQGGGRAQAHPRDGGR